MRCRDRNVAQALWPLFGAFTVSCVASSVLSDWSVNSLIMFAPFILNSARIKAMYAPWHGDSVRFRIGGGWRKKSDLPILVYNIFSAPGSVVRVRYLMVWM